MQVTVGQPISNNNPREQFVVYGKAVHGDDDKYEDLVVGEFDKDFQYTSPGRSYSGTHGATPMEALIRLLKVMEGLETDDDAYSKLPGFEELIAEYWVTDVTNDEYDAFCEGWYVRWFDENGIEHEVDVKL